MDTDVVSFDLEFVDNARIEWFTWESESASGADTDRRALDAARVLSQLWRPDEWMVAVGSFTHGFPDHERYERRVLPEPAGEGILEIAPARGGAIRIAVPELADPEHGWRLRDDDGNRDVPHEVQPAEPLDGLRTVWVHAPAASSDLSVFVDAEGEVRARLTLGATVFAPTLDERSPGQLVLGAPVAAWHEANAALLARVVAQMRDDGWSRA